MISYCKNRSAHPLVVAAFFCVILYIVGINCRPLLPVDETRYLTVAWEMFRTKDWVLPHLNEEPYDHKPPLLFWSINFLWSFFGPTQQAAMAVPFIFAFAFAAATYRLAKKLLPENPDFPALVTYILIGSLPFIVYSNMIMFDLLLGIFSVIGLTAVWDYAKTGNRKHLYIFAAAIGLGAITKGPVILLHTILPILFIKFWQNKEYKVVSFRKWTFGFLLAILCGILLGLSWAVPAAVKGGPEFADKIFWGQTAGRINNAFDHKAPFWWYFPFLPALLLPWAFSPLFWRGVKKLKNSPYQEIIKFIAIWVPPVFLCFCFISGKQIHYLLPLIPGIAIFTALAFMQAKQTFRCRDAILPFVVTGILILLPLLMKIFALDFPFLLNGRPLLTDILTKISLTVPFLLFCVSALIVTIFRKRSLNAHVLSLSIASLMIMVCFQIEAKNGLFKNYDLRPIAKIVQKNPDAPLAFTRNYHGEWGYLARLDRPVKELELKFLPQWFRENPHGMAFLRTGHPAELQPYDVIFSMPYKMDNTYNIVVKQGQAAHFVK